ncbi:SDR family NAD(P)-dependent oxidoreductase [Paracoccus sp. (in: a-proteobacteria)]|uniref:SDR family NAD(P)-dependent oxidoreductase n=1 Tax=Paracoccus sp. TaxID=267 RepID=UPI003A850F33
MRIDLTGRVFAVTGAAQGIGAAIVAALAGAGARVATVDLDGPGMAGLPGATSCHRADLGQRDAAHAVMDDIAAAHGRIDGLVTAAGGVCGQTGQPLERIDAPCWRAILAANLDAAMWCAQAATPHLKARRGGRIVTISSGAGLRPSLTGIQAYTAAKHALIGLTKQLAQELGPYGITVNSVAPGFLRSNPSTERQWQALGPDGQARLVAGTHLRRLGQPQDIADAVTFLASDQAGWITGQTLSVDGGRA